MVRTKYELKINVSQLFEIWKIRIKLENILLQWKNESCDLDVLGLGSVHIKDESKRQGQQAFKV